MKKSIPFIALATSALGLSFALGIQANAKEALPALAGGVHEHDGATFTGLLNQSDFDDPSSLPTSGAYYLTSDIVISQSTDLRINGTNTFKLCLSGHSIKKGSGGDLNITIASEATFELYDCSTVEHKYKLNDDGVALVDDTLTADYETFSGGYITGFDDTVIDGTGTFSIYGGTFVGNSSAYPALRNTKETNIYGGSFIGNVNLGGNGGVIRAAGKLNIEGGKFLYNKAQWSGGAVIYSDYQPGMSVNIANAEFLNNFSYRGGAVAIECNNYDLDNTKDSTVTITNSTFKNNACADNTYFNSSGGGLSFIQNGILETTFTVTDSVFDNNTSAEYGGGLAVSSDDDGIINTTFNNVLITNNKSEKDGGGFYSTNNSKGIVNFTMNGGLISGNTAGRYGGGLLVGSTNASQKISKIELKAGKITGNTAKYGGGIYTYVQSQYGVYGSFQVSDNLNDEKKPDNIFIPSTESFGSGASDFKSGYIVLADALNDDAKFGIRMEEPGDFTILSNSDKSSQNLKHFFSDDESYAVAVNSSTGQLTLVSHIHNWSYSASGATITATCGAEDCTVTEGLTLTLKAPAGDLHYDGNAKVATIQDGYSTEAFPEPVIKYFQGDKEVTSCVNVGKYTAKVTFGTATASVDFEILGKVLSDDTSDVSVEIDDAVVPEDVELRVEVRADVKEKQSPEEYAKIGELLEANERIVKVYDVRLIQITGGVEKEIQPSDLKPGLTIRVRMTIPSEVSRENLTVLHIHSLTDMEFIDKFETEGDDFIFEVSKLSQFAFINTFTPAASGGIIALIVILVVLGLLGICFLLLFFVFAKFIIVKDKEGEEKVVRAIKIGTEGKDDEKLIKLVTFKFKKELRAEEEVFKKKKDAEDYLKEHQGEEPVKGESKPAEEKEPSETE